VEAPHGAPGAHQAELACHRKGDRTVKSGSRRRDRPLQRPERRWSANVIRVVPRRNSFVPEWNEGFLLGVDMNWRTNMVNMHGTSSLPRSLRKWM